MSDDPDDTETGEQTDNAEAGEQTEDTERVDHAEDTGRVEESDDTEGVERADGSTGGEEAAPAGGESNGPGSEPGDDLLDDVRAALDDSEDADDGVGSDDTADGRVGSESSGGPPDATETPQSARTGHGDESPHVPDEDGGESAVVDDPLEAGGTSEPPEPEAGDEPMDDTPPVEPSPAAPDEPPESGEDHIESEGSDTQTADSADAPLSDLLSEMDRAEAESQQEPGVDWEDLADEEGFEQPRTDSGAEAVDPEADEHIVDKQEYCQRCEYLGEPPALRCTNEGTEIVEVVDSEHFRVRSCPMVSEDGPAFEQHDG